MTVLPVQEQGYIRWQGPRWEISQALRHERIGIELLGDRALVYVCNPRVKPMRSQRRFGFRIGRSPQWNKGSLVVGRPLPPSTVNKAGGHRLPRTAKMRAKDRSRSPLPANFAPHVCLALLCGVKCQRGLGNKCQGCPGS